MASSKAQPDRPPDFWFVADYYLLSPDLPYGMTDDRPSGLRVLAKSLHLLALGWVASVVWLWLAQVQITVRRFASAPQGYASDTLVEGIVPALLVEVMAIWVTLQIARVPGAGDPRREWLHALWWTLVPNAMLIGTAYLTIAAAR